jgi:hypothetical protein
VPVRRVGLARGCIGHTVVGMARLCEACGAANAKGRSPYCLYCGMQPRVRADAPIDADGLAKKPASRWHMARQSLWLIGPAVAALLFAHPWTG